MATTLVEPVAPWLRDLGQVLHNQATANAFIPPADLLVDDDGSRCTSTSRGCALRTSRSLDPAAIQASLSDGVLTLRVPKPETMRPRRIEIKAEQNGGGEVRTGEPAGARS